MTVSSIEFSGLLCSRLCHDLLSPVGASLNGLELLDGEQDPGMRSQITELLRESAETSGNKLKFFRLAFGSVGRTGEEVESAEAQAAIRGLFARDSRITLDWMVERERLPRPAIKILLNLALIAIETLAHGGQMTIGAEMRDKIAELVVRVEGNRLLVDAAVGRALRGELADSAVTPRLVPAALVRQLALEGGGAADAVSPAPTILVFGATYGGR